MIKQYPLFVSHHAFSYMEPSYSQSGTSKTLRPYWQCQYADLQEQYDCGIRVFEIRIMEKDGILYSSHTYIFATLDQCLAEFKKLQFRHTDIALLIREDGDHSNFEQFSTNFFCLHYLNINLRNIKLYTDSSHSAFWFINFGAIQINSFWPNSDNPRAIVEFLNHQMNSNQGCLRVIDFVMTQQSKVNNFLTEFTLLVKSNKQRDEDLEGELHKWPDNSINCDPIAFIRIDFANSASRNKILNIKKKLKIY